MSFKTVEHVIASAVVDTGTFTVAYPPNRDAGYYRNTVGHKIVTEENDRYLWPQDFTLSFGTSSVTVTWANSRTLAAGTKLFVEFQEHGDQETRTNAGALVMKPTPRAQKLTRVELNLGAPDTADADGYFVSQDLTSAGVASVSGTAAAAIAAAALAGTADVPRNVVASWTGAAVITITGYDEYGNLMVEKSASGTSLTGKKAFKQVTNIAVSANVTSLTVGTGDVLGLPIFVPAIQNIAGEYQSGVGLARFRDGKIYIPVFINATDLAAGTAQQFNAPCAGYITGLRGIVQVAIVTGGAITVEANTATVTGLSITAANSDAAGVQYSSSIKKIAAGLVAAGDDCTITPAAAFNGGGAIMCEVEFSPIPGTNGTFVAGSTSEPTATTGDVRGTYDPDEVCNGTLEFSLFVDVADPDYLGFDQYAG